jgi:hypothetical protein
MIFSDAIRGKVCQLCRDLRAAAAAKTFDSPSASPSKACGDADGSRAGKILESIGGEALQKISKEMRAAGNGDVARGLLGMLCVFGDYHGVKELLEQGVDVNWIDYGDELQSAPLHSAMLGGDLRVATLLLQWHAETEG